MKISYNWLLSHIKTDVEVQKLSEILTNTGLEVEGIEDQGNPKNYLEGVVVGKVISLEKHPNADKLKIAMVDIGEAEPLQIVCGAPNIAEEQKVPVATVGSHLPTPDGGTFKITQAKLRGVASFGMICSEAELGVNNNHDGIWVLEPAYKVGTPLGELFQKSNADVLIEIGLTPNRSDAMSHFGVARDLNAALNVLNLKTELLPISTEGFDALERKGENPIQIEVKEPTLAMRYAGIYLENIQVKASPLWLKERLKTIGLQSLNNVVDITNYILHDLGQPLHAFDAAKIAQHKIIVQKLPKGEKFTTLEGVERTLNGEELMICDGNGGMCMAGVYGGIHSGVTENTQSIFLESAYFQPVSIRKSAKFHHLNTDASFRFERGTDPNMVLVALKKAVELLVKYADAKIVGEIYDHYPQPIEHQKIALRYHKIDQLLGERLHRENIKEVLKSLDITILSESNETLEVSVPPYRADVQREVDLIEEILRIYGYNKIKTPEKVSFSVVKNEGKNALRIENTIANALVAQGFFEAMNNSVIKLSDIETFGLDAQTAVKLLNPLSSDLALMRPSMLPGLLSNAAFNINRKNNQLKLFEFGKVYFKENQQHSETYRLALMVSGPKASENWVTPSQKASFFTLKGVVVQLMKKIGITNFQEIPYQNVNYEDAIALTVNGKQIANLGVVNQKLAKQLDVDQAVFIAEIDWSEWVKLAMAHEIDYKNPSKFPAVKRDLALLIDQGISYQDLHASCMKLDLDLLKSIQLFDVYEGDKLPEGKKSYAMTFLLQDEQKTLNDHEIEAVMQQLIHNFEVNFQAELRS